MFKLLLHTDNEKLNQLQALKSINDSEISRKNMSFNFIKSNNKYWCIITTDNKEREQLSKELQDSSITYDKLKAKAFS